MVFEATPRDKAMPTTERFEQMRLERSMNIFRQNPVRVVSTTNLTLSGRQTIDGVALIPGDQVLVAGQTAGQDNGFYEVREGTWFRTWDGRHSDQYRAGRRVYVSEGTANGGSVWVLQTANVVLGTTAQVWANNFTAEQSKHGLMRVNQQFGNPLQSVVNVASGPLFTAAFPAAVAGDHFHVRVVGDHTNSTGANRTFSFSATLAGVNLFTGVATANQSSSANPGKWIFDWGLMVQAVGGSPVVSFGGDIDLVATGFTTSFNASSLFAGSNILTTINLATSQNFILTCTPSIADPNLSMRTFHGFVDRMRV